jgi:RNA polymerase sigma-70 factor (ECF subfamily)
MTLQARRSSGAHSAFAESQHTEESAVGIDFLEGPILMNTPILAGNDFTVEDSPAETSDELLVFAAKSGDAGAFVELSNRHSSKTLWRIYRITRNWEDAEDALQDSFLKAFTHLKNFEGRSSFSSWLTRIAINSALMILRKKRPYLEISIDGRNDDHEAWQACEPRDPTEDPETLYAQREREELLRGAILRLRPHFRDVVHLEQTQECSTKEIAQTLGISVAAAKSRLLRAKMALRASLR